MAAREIKSRNIINPRRRSSPCVEATVKPHRKSRARRAEGLNAQFSRRFQFANEKGKFEVGSFSEWFSPMFEKLT